MEVAMNTAQVIPFTRSGQDAQDKPLRSMPDVASKEIGEGLLDSWMSDLDPSTYTRKAYLKAVRQFLAFAGTTPQRADLKAWRKHLSQTTKPNTLSLYIGAVRRLFQWINDNDLFDGYYANIAAGIKGAKISREFKRDCLTATQAKEIIDAAPTMRDKAMLALMITAGLRDIEVARADIGDLRTTAAGPVLHVWGKGRSGKDEYVKVSNHTLKAILAYLETRAGKKETDPLFTSESNNSSGKRLSTGAISTIAKYAMIQAGYDSSRLSAHSLRHTAATLALLNGSTLQEVCQMMRHKNINTTLIYAHNLERMSNQSESRIDSAVFGDPEQ